MKTWREYRVGKGVKRPKSKHMRGLNIKPQKMFRSNIKQLKEIQTKTLRKLNADLKILNQLIISPSGLNTLSENSIKQIHEKRKKANIRITKLISDLTTINKKINILERKYKKSLK